VPLGLAIVSWQLPRQTRDKEEPAKINPNIKNNANYTIKAIKGYCINNTFSNLYKEEKGKSKKDPL
jgi:hypothetical protein